jgi:uncharacterized protein YktA (UPF0223 family)
MTRRKFVKSGQNRGRKNEAGEKVVEYQYPIDYNWSTDEIVDVIKFFEVVERAYETGITREEILNTYRRFKEIVPSKAEEKKICGEFEEISGYSAYRTITRTKDAQPGEKILMK